MSYIMVKSRRLVALLRFTTTPGAAFTLRNLKSRTLLAVPAIVTVPAKLFAPPAREISIPAVEAVIVVAPTTVIAAL